MIILFIIPIVLAGCSEIPSNERKDFCESLNLTYYSSGNNYFTCIITIRDSDYIIIKEQNLNPYSIYSNKNNFTDCYDKKFIDSNKLPKCNEWCNEGKEYDFDICYHNCVDTWRTCKKQK